MKLIIGCGNILLRDEGIGVHCVEFLKQGSLPPGVEVLDGGTAGFDLIGFIQEAEKAVIIDAIKVSGNPGAIYRFSAEDFDTDSAPETSLHDVTLKDLFRILGKLGICLEISIIGVEPKSIEAGMELSPELAEMIPTIGEVALKEVDGV